MLERKFPAYVPVKTEKGAKREARPWQGTRTLVAQAVLPSAHTHYT